MVTNFDPETANVVASSDHPDCKRYALIDGDGIVQNVVLWDGNLDTWQPPEGLTPVKVPDTDNALHSVGIGWRRARNGRWVASESAADPIPQQATITDPAAFQQALTNAVNATTTADKLDAVIAILSNLG